MSARDFSVGDVLRNGTSVTIRAVRPDDVTRLTDAFARLERDSVYRRFFTFKNELATTELARLETMDFVRDVMLVATIPTAQFEIIIGSGRYVAHQAEGANGAAEVAFTIADDYQGLGLAGRLLEHLAAIGRRCGIAHFEAHVLPVNKGMLRVFERSGLPMRRRLDEGVVHVTLALEDAS